MSYSPQEIDKINKLTTHFYSEIKDSFSETRQNKWFGWDLCLPYIQDVFANKSKPKVLDLGCGNFRFEKFLNENFSQIDYDVDALDNIKFNTELPVKTRFFKIDILNNTINNIDFIAGKKYDLVVAFGLLHHIPGENNRKKLLKLISSSLVNESAAIVSFWNFSNDKRIFNKAKIVTDKVKDMYGFSKLENNDYFLNWKDRNDVFRFCHDFANEETKNLYSGLNIFIKKTFCSDGKNNKLNKYVIGSSVENMGRFSI